MSDVSYCVIGGLVAGVWAMLSIVGNEHARRTQNLRTKYATPPASHRAPEPVDPLLSVK